MQQSHGVSYAEYERDLNHRLEIERERERSYRKSLEIVQEVGNQLHR